ncbi:MAG TPA: hypothetical protein VE817_11660 [Candidatus Acidoferrum sp.]|nr:hypothetical protein [Candidatus Acidoferrum sp.]
MRLDHRRPEIPTFVEAVTAWRGWSLVEVDGEVRLSSLTRPEVWTPRAPHAASCPKGRTPTPQRRCRCGVYAAVSPEALAELRALPGGVVGEVSLWGRVIEHGRGFRAGVGYPARLGLVCAACQAEGSATRADAIQRVAVAGRTRLIPWCTHHAPPTADTPARPVESSLLSVYAVDPVADELIARLRGPASVGRDRDAPPARRGSGLRAAVVVVLLVLAGLVLGRIDAPRSAAGSTGWRPTKDDLAYRAFLRSPDEGLGVYPPIRIVLHAVRDQDGLMCGHAEDGTVVPTDCYDDRTNAYVFDIAPSHANRAAACAGRADVVTQRGSNLLCWQRIVAVQ